MAAKREKLILWAGVVVFAATIFLISIFKYFRFGFNGFDLAIYNQTFWNTVHGRWFMTSINPPSYLGDHAEWLIVALAPLYALLPHPLTLVLLNIVAIAVSAIPIWLIAKIKFSDAKTRLLFPLLWLINPYVWNLSLFEFHMITFAVPLTLFAAYFFLKDRWIAFMVMVAALLLCREDMAFIVIGFALLAAFEMIRRRKQRSAVVKWIIVPIILAIIVFALDQKIIAHFNPDGIYKFFILYSWLGSSAGSIASAIIRDPLKIVLHLFSLTNLYLVLALLLPVLFLPFIRARFLIVIAIVSIEYMLTSGGGEGVIIKTQYAAAFLPAIMLAALEGYERLINSKAVLKFIPKEILPAIMIAASVYVWLVYGPGIGLANGFAAPDARAQAMQAAVALIPKNAPVVASVDALTELSSRQTVYPATYFWIGKKQYGTSDYSVPIAPEYVMLDQKDFVYFAMVYPRLDWAKKLYPTAPARLRSFLENGNYGIVFDRNGIAVLKRGAGGPLPFVAVHETKPAILNAINEKMGPLDFLGWTSGATGAHLFFSADQKIGKDLVIKINGEFFPLGNGLYPATDWKPGEIIEIMPPVATGKMEMRLYSVSGGLNVASDGSLIFGLDTARPESDIVTFP